MYASLKMVRASGTSQVDPLNFTVYALTSFTLIKPTMPANGVWIDDRFHLFLFGSKGTIVSQWSRTDLIGLRGRCATGPVDEAYVKDPTIICGRYLMFYVTNIP